MKVLVTGANGFLASNIIRELLLRGADVRGMVRRNCNDNTIQGLNIELCFGNIVSYQDVRHAVEGCDIVIHAAANTSQAYSVPLPLIPVNVNGTANVVRAAKEFNVKRLIFVSTANTIGLDPDDEQHDRLSSYYLKSGYALSKMKAEKLILKEVKAGNLSAVIVNPTFMIGAYDAKPGSGRIFMLLLKHNIVFYPPGGKNFVDVKSAAVAICNAIDKGENGGRYPLAGVNLSFREFLAILNKIENRNPVQIRIPTFFLILAGIIGSVLRAVGLKVELNYSNARILTMCEDISGEKATEELLMPKTDVENAIADALCWFRKNGYIHSKK